MEGKRQGQILYQRKPAGKHPERNGETGEAEDEMPHKRKPEVVMADAGILCRCDCGYYQ